jgi:type I restriction enzyme M protein
MSNVSGAVKSIQDIMRKDVGVDGDAQRISQMVWMIFLKIYDDREEELELTQDGYRSPIPDKYRWRNWASDREGITGDALVKFIDELFFALKTHLPTIGDIGKRAQVIRDVFEDTYNYMKSGTLMRQVVNKINEIDFNSTHDRHTFGAIYEQILKDLQSAGNAGEFYTPRAVTKFIIDRLAPKLDEKVFDPACGTGGFLACAIDYKRQFVKSSDDETRLQSTIRGVEKKALPHMLCVTNMILHGIDTPSGIVHGNTLEKPYRDYGEKDRVPVIATNPPFGGMEQDGIEGNFPANLRTRETADLFMALIIKLLKNGGRAAVVLPDGFLFGEGVKTSLKQSLIQECNLHTIVRLPKNVFAPYTGIATNILFFTKGKPTSDVWFYEHPYPAGVSSYNKSRPMQFEEFQAEREWWGDEADGFRTRKPTAQAWRISANDVIARGYNLDIKNPHAPESINHDPNDLLESHDEQQAGIQSIRDQLKAILWTALQASVSDDVAALVSDHLDIWTAAIEHNSGTGRSGRNKRLNLYGIERLKILILDLAVRGRLVPQDSKEECASNLVKHIKSVKPGYLLEQGLPKQRSIVRPIQQTPFELPSSWVWTRLGDISAYMQRGKSPKYSEGSGVLVVSQRCVQWAGLDLDVAKEISLASLESYEPYRFLKTGDLLWNSTGTGTIGRVLALSDVPEGLVCDSHVTLVRCPWVNARYLQSWLASEAVYGQIEELAAGSTNQIEWTAQLAMAQLVPLPPLAEQERIVARIAELTALCDKLEARIIDASETQRQLADAIVDRALA